MGIIFGQLRLTFLIPLVPSTNIFYPEPLPVFGTHMAATLTGYFLCSRYHHEDLPMVSYLTQSPQPWQGGVIIIST